MNGGRTTDSKDVGENTAGLGEMNLINVPGVGPKRKAALEAEGIKNVADLAAQPSTLGMNARLFLCYSTLWYNYKETQIECRDVQEEQSPATKLNCSHYCAKIKPVLKTIVKMSITKLPNDNEHVVKIRSEDTEVVVKWLGKTSDPENWNWENLTGEVLPFLNNLVVGTTPDRYIVYRSFVPVYTVFEKTWQKGRPIPRSDGYMVMESLDGDCEKFAKWQLRLEQSESRISAYKRNVLRCWTEILRAVDMLHRHDRCFRDMKPVNVGYKMWNDYPVFKLIDIDCIRLHHNEDCSSVHYFDPHHLRMNYAGRTKIETEGDEVKYKEYIGTLDLWRVGFSCLMMILPLVDDKYRQDILFNPLSQYYDDEKKHNEMALTAQLMTMQDDSKFVEGMKVTVNQKIEEVTQYLNEENEVDKSLTQLISSLLSPDIEVRRAYAVKSRLLVE